MQQHHVTLYSQDEHKVVGTCKKGMGWVIGEEAKINGTDEHGSVSGRFT